MATTRPEILPARQPARGRHTPSRRWVYIAISLAGALCLVAGLVVATASPPEIRDEARGLAILLWLVLGVIRTNIENQGGVMD